MSAADIVTCGTCYRSWDFTAHPTPASLCPFCNGDERAAAPHEVTTPTTLPRHLALLDERARLALAILDGTASDDEHAALRDSLDLEADDLETAAEDYLHSGYAFTPSPGTATVAVLAAGGPEIHLARHGDGYALTGYTPGHRDAVRTSPAITAWGRLRDDEQVGR